MASKPITKLGLITSGEVNAFIAKGAVQVLPLKSPLNDFALWFERGEKAHAITRIQFAFTNQMRSGLVQAGYTEIPNSLSLNSKVVVSLWFYQGSTKYDNPIVDLQLSFSPDDEARLFSEGWEKVGCDFLRGNDQAFSMFLWVKREITSYICDITASNTYENNHVLFEAGYTRIDETINRKPGGQDLFLWIRKSSDKSKALTYFDVSEDLHQYQEKVEKSYERIDTNFGHDAKEIYVWYDRNSDIQVQNLTVLVSQKAVDPFKKWEIPVVKLGETGWPTFIAWK